MFASDSYNIRVSVPFDFMAGKTYFPAGDYQISEQEQSGILTIEGAKGSAMMLTSFGSAEERETPGVSFMRTAKGVVLKSVHTYGRPVNLVPEAEAPRQ